MLESRICGRLPQSLMGDLQQQADVDLVATPCELVAAPPL